MPVQNFLRRYLRAEIAIAITAALAGVLVLSAPASAYPWVKAFHVIAVIAWMAGMLYLPRLFVYCSSTTAKPSWARSSPKPSR
jgi:hypothetical protein